MKKLALIFALSCVTISAYAMPRSTDDLIKELTAGKQLGNLIKQEQNIGKVSITRVANFRDDSTIEFLCGSDINSRSAAVLRVDVIYTGTVAAVHSSTHYFVSRGLQKDLKRCTGQ